MGAVANAGHDLGQFGRQQVPGVHRHHLPQFHCRPAQVRQAIRDPADIARRQHQVAHPRPFAIRQSARAFRQHAAGDAARQSPELAQA